ncbi:MAG: M36 family metallopeptidase, partial [Myxococcota bacterium]|nr:M36 family metallopeptidase [Myxococcota bacterium]
MLSLLALASLPAVAFQHTDAVHIGQEPTRVRRVHTERQYALRHAPAWQSFTAATGHGWQVVFDEKTGTPHRAWGPGIPLGALADGDQAAAAVRRLLAQHPGLAGVPARNLRLGHSAFDAKKSRWFIRLDQVVPGDNQLHGDPDGTLEHFGSHGAPVVWRGAVEAWIQDDRLTMLSADTYPGASRVGTSPTLTAAQAIQVAIDHGPASEQAHDVDGAVLVVLPREVDGSLTHDLTWMVRSRTGDVANGQLPGHWVSFVEAHDGSLLNVHNQVRYLSGVVSGRHDTRTVDGEFSISPIRNATVVGDNGDEATTDADGAFTIEGASAATIGFDGEYFRVVNDAGDEATVEWAGGEFTWGEEDTSIAEIDSYVFLNMTQAWAAQYAFDVPLSTFKIRSTVNIQDSCNAFYDGNVNFFQRGDGCNNTGRILDVNAHEWGHGLHYSAANSYYLDGAVGEGAGDTLAVLITGDPVMAPYFMESGRGIREVDSNRRYPDDVVGQVHTDGLIYGGAMWDTWAELEDELGPEAGYDVVARLFVETLQFNPELAETYDATVAADDDNGDLSDGTPHQCAILDGFAPHGLGPGGAATIIDLAHPVLENQPGSQADYPVEADLINLAPGCVELGLDTAAVVYSTDGGETWDTAALSGSGDAVTGLIP